MMRYLYVCLGFLLLACAPSSAPEKITFITITQDDVLIIQKHIKKQWVLPSDIKKLETLETVVRLNISDSGMVKKLEFVRPSGLTIFDNAVLRAIRRSQPFPLPVGKENAFHKVELHFTGD